MARKLLLVLAALLLPGGLVALLGALLVTRLARSEGGQRFLERGRQRANRFRRRVKPVPAITPALEDGSQLLSS